MTNRRKSADNRTMALSDHLRELRNRFFLVAAILMLSSSLVYAYRAQIIPIILGPYEASFEAEQLMYLNPAGGFSFIFFISIYAGLAVTLPVLIHQIYCFVRPTLPKSKQSIAGRLLLASSLLLVAGILFGYFVAVPGALKFLSEFASDYVSAALTADSYLHFLIAYTIGLGLLFQAPLLLILFHFISPLTPGGLLRSERWVIVITMIAAAIITPTPDPVNMLIVAVPIIGIYQLGVVAVLVSIYHKRRLAKKAISKHSRETPAAPQANPQPAIQPSPQAPFQPQQARTAPMLIDSITSHPRPRPSLRPPARQTPPPSRPLSAAQLNTNTGRRYIDGISPIYRSI